MPLRNLGYTTHIARLDDPADVRTVLKVHKIKDAEPDDLDQRPFYQIEAYVTEGTVHG